MTSGLGLSTLVGGIENLIDLPLEFTRNLFNTFDDHVIAAFQKPIPTQDPISSYRYLNARRQTLIDSVRQPPLIRMQDQNYNQLATIGQERSCRFEEIASDAGEAGVVIRGGDYLAEFVRNAVRVETDLHLSIDPVATQPDWKTRWGGKITDIGIKRDSSGIHTVELIATSNREHLKNILVGTTPWFPPEIQPIKMWMLPANFRTAAAITLFINLGRLFFPPLSVLTNIFNPGGWINPLGADALLNFDPLSWPIQCQFINLFRDQSRTSLLTAAWSNFHDMIVDPARDAGCCARVYTWFTEDKTGPHPELELLIRGGGGGLLGGGGGLLGGLLGGGETTTEELVSLARPHRNCLIAAFEDHSGADGPTGTVLDGPINLFAKTLDDLITTTVLPVDEDDDGVVDPLFQKLFGTAPKKPKVIFREGQASGIVESQYNQHKGPVLTTMTGGRSPKIVNDLQTFGIKWGLSQLSNAIELALREKVPPGTPGLEEIYTGQLDNILFAWQRYTDIFRALRTGDFAYQEWFEHPGSAAYTVSAVINLRAGNFKKRPFRSFKTSIRNGAPWIVNVDFGLDDRVAFEVDSILYVDQVGAYKYSYDRRKPITWEMSVGDQSKDIDPFAQGIRALQSVFTIASMAAGEGWFF